MTEVYIGQVMMTGFGYAPRYFALCNGQTLSITQNQALFALLGTRYGGDGRTTFMLPNLQGRTPVGAGPSQGSGWSPTPYPEGALAGVETVALASTQMPAHTHVVNAYSGAATNPFPDTPSLYATTTTPGGGQEPIYTQTFGQQVPLMASTISTAGAGQAHDNMQPFRVINFNIAMSGIYPSRN